MEKEGWAEVLLLLMKCGLCCVYLCTCVFWRPQVRTKIMTSFLFSFAETLFFHNSLFIKASIRLSIPPPSLLASNFAPSLLKSQRSHLHPNRQEHTHRKGTVCLSQTHRHGGRCHGFVFYKTTLQNDII